MEEPIRVSSYMSLLMMRHSLQNLLPLGQNLQQRGPLFLRRLRVHEWITVVRILQAKHRPDLPGHGTVGVLRALAENRDDRVIPGEDVLLLTSLRDIGSILL